MPVKKAARTKKTPRGKKPMGLTSAIGPKATTMVVVVVMAAGIMVAARQQQARAKERVDSAHADVVLSADPDARKSAAPTSIAAGETVAAPAATGTTGAGAKPITVTGCLERADGGFRLKETSGAEVPKARSWKSGFLKKSSTSLDVVDPARALQLGTHVGRRVSVTGTLVDRDLQAKSVRRVGACKAE